MLNAQNAGAIGVIIANNGGDRRVRDGRHRPQGQDPVGDDQPDRRRDPEGGRHGDRTLRKNAAQPLQIDGDLDTDIVFHEYGHGLTWRMIGGMSGPLAGAIGEGASDMVAFLINGDDAIGEYAYGNPLGIRRYPYDDYPLTYGDVTGAEVHNDGEIYAADHVEAAANCCGNVRRTALATTSWTA